MPMNLIPNFLQATPVVPTPIYGSITVLSLKEKSFNIAQNNSVGFCVGCIVFSSLLF
jgi:hypothetical protein